MQGTRADMQFVRYHPVCYTTKDLNANDTDNGRACLLFNNDKIWKSGDGHDTRFIPCKPNQCQGYEKEILRQTMLQHEAVFKDQVKEMHRLYKRQRELMEEMNRTELSRHNPEAKTSQFDLCLSQKLSESAQKTCLIPNMLLVNPICHYPSALYTEKFQAPSSFFTGKSLQACPNTSIKAINLKDLDLLSSSSKKFGKRTFDLELPADEYVDSEEGEKFKEGKVLEVSEAPGCPPKDLLATYRQSDSKLSLCNGQLNSSQVVPFRNCLILGKTNDLVDVNKVIQLEEAGALFATSHLQKPHWNLTKEIACCIQAREDLETCSESLHPKKMAMQREYASSNQSLPQSSRSILIAAQALPCFETPAWLSENSTLSVGNFWLNGNKVYLTRNSTCGPSFESVASLQNSLLPGFRSESLTVKTCPISTSFNPLDSMDLRSAKEVDSTFMLSSGLPDLSISLEKVRDIHGDNKPEASLGGLHWLKENPVHSGITHKEGESFTQMESGSTKAFLMSSSEVEAKRNGNSDSSNYEMAHGSVDNSHFANDQFSAVVPNPHPNLSEDKVSEKARGLTCSAGRWSDEGDLVVNGVDCKFQIDLNSPLNEDESAQIVMKSTADINLEPPVSPENKESSPPRGQSEDKQIATSVQFSEQEDGCPKKDLSLIAAEALVLISSAEFEMYLDNTTSKPFETSCTCLQWFAGIASSSSDVLENETGTVLSDAADVNYNELLANGIDYFEAMTSQLEETRVEEYCCKSTEQKKKRTAATLLPSRPKRRRTRRTKSQKDFQGEILPCLAPSSKHEVTEKLHINVELREAAGTLETGYTRKNASRNGRLRGKKQNTNISPPILVERPMCSLLKQQTAYTELGFLLGCLAGWGKTNKRRSGQRFPARHPSLKYNRVI